MLLKWCFNYTIQISDWQICKIHLVRPIYAKFQIDKFQVRPIYAKSIWVVEIEHSRKQLIDMRKSIQVRWEDFRFEPDEEDERETHISSEGHMRKMKGTYLISSEDRERPSECSGDRAEAKTRSGGNDRYGGCDVFRSKINGCEGVMVIRNIPKWEDSEILPTSVSFWKPMDEGFKSHLWIPFPISKVYQTRDLMGNGIPFPRIPWESFQPNAT